MSRSARRERVTKETSVVVELDLDGTGTANVSTGVPFFDHMLAQLARHGLLDLAVAAEGDIEIDAHHTVEDTAITRHFFESLTASAGICLHLSVTGRNPHHIVEAQFKAVARALRAAVAPDPRAPGVPSTKGVL